MTITIHRYPLAHQADLSEAAEAIFNEAKYTKDARIEDAPNEVDCLTMVHYIFKESLGVALDLTYIGSMPGQLHALGWDVKVISIQELESGDVIFATSSKRAAFITHTAIYVKGIGGLDSGFLHVSQTRGHAEVIHPHNFLRHYSQILTAEFELRHIDPRDMGQLELIGKPFRKEPPSEPVSLPMHLPSRTPTPPPTAIANSQRPHSGTQTKVSTPFTRTPSCHRTSFG